MDGRVSSAPSARAEAADVLVPELLRGLGQILHQGVMLLDRRGDIVWMNDVALRIHGLSRQSIRNVQEYETRYAFRHPGDLTANRNPLPRALTGETLREEDYHVIPKDGRPAWRCRLSARPTRDERGAVSGAIVVIDDVTDEHHDDEQRKALLVRERLARTAAERERDFIQNIFEAAPMPIIVFEGTEHRLAFLNTAAADLTGLSTLQGRKHADILPRDDARIKPTLDAVYQGAANNVPLEMDYQLPNGVLTLQSHYVPLPGPQQRPIGVVWLAIDVTARRRAERELESARRRLSKSERLSALGALVSGVAHELRTPLVYIMNNMYLVRRRLERAAALSVEQELLPRIDEALSGVQRIERIVGELRKFGELHPRPSLASLDEVVRPAIDLFEATHVGVLQLSADLQPTPQIEADAYQIQQVVLNLLQNAAEAMPGGGVIRIRTSAHEGSARLVVQDEGTGIPQEAQELVFDEFFTTKPGGTGLGLAIVRRIVHDHKGKIRFQTSPEGTRFTVELPPHMPPR